MKTRAEHHWLCSCTVCWPMSVDFVEGASALRAFDNICHHEWKEYIGLTGLHSFVYCKLCDKKSDEV